MGQTPYVSKPGTWTPRNMLLENVDCRLLVGVSTSQSFQDRCQVSAGDDRLDAVLLYAGQGILLTHKRVSPRVRHEPACPGGPE